MKIFLQILVIGTGGFVGANLRYFLGLGIQKLCGESSFPFGTMGVNILGCFLFGLLIGLSESLNIFTVEQRLFVFTGFLGALTTFSTFSYETFSLLRDQNIIAALLNAGVQLLVGLFVVWLGFYLAHLLK